MSTLRTILASGRVALHSKPSRRQLHGAPAHLAIPQAHRVLLLPHMRAPRPAVPTRRYPPLLPAASRSCHSPHPCCMLCSGVEATPLLVRHLVQSWHTAMD